MTLGCFQALQGSCMAIRVIPSLKEFFFCGLWELIGDLGIIPVAIWGVLKWYGSESANLLECLALYGYANLVWVPVAIASVSPITSRFSRHKEFNVSDAWMLVLNYVFVGIGFGVSALFLFRNMYVNFMLYQELVMAY
jgi:hypothetical protein